MEDKKRRTTNFTNNEKTVLAELVMKYKDIVENKRSDATSNAHKIAGWTRLAQEFNSMCTSASKNRTANNLKTCWENVKSSTKKQVSLRKKEIFMTGGTPHGNNATGAIVEAVLGPALEGLSNIYDCDEPDYNSTDTAQPVKIDIGAANWSPVQTVCDKQWNNDALVLCLTEENKENQHQQDDVNPSTSTTKESEKTHLYKNEDEMPLAEPLRSSKEKGDEWIRRRRPKTDFSSDALMREKIELAKILKKNAEDEGSLRVLILREQLKQEQIKTENY